MLSAWHFIKTMRTELELIQQLVMKYESSFCAANGTGSRRSSTHDFGFNTWNTHTAYIHQPLSCSDKKKQGHLDGSLNYIIDKY